MNEIGPCPVFICTVLYDRGIGGTNEVTTIPNSLSVVGQTPSCHQAFAQVWLAYLSSNLAGYGVSIHFA
jgi:hypothetical protein